MRRALRGVPITVLALMLATAAAGQQGGDPDPDRGLPLEPTRWARFAADRGFAERAVRAARAQIEELAGGTGAHLVLAEPEEFTS